MPIIHRDGDLRICGATTMVTHQASVYLNGRLVAVEGDECTHGNGALISTSNTEFYVEGKKVIVVGDYAFPDTLCYVVGGLHCAPIPITGSEDAF